MNTIRKMLVIGVAVAGLGTSAAGVMAQPGPAAGPGAGKANSTQVTPEQREAWIKDRMARRAANLKEKLNLTASQEPAWNAYVARMTPDSRKGQRPSRAELAAMSAPERMERQLAQLKTMEGVMSQRLEATKSFYAALTPEQQKIFNESTGRSAKGHGRHGQGMHGHGHGHGHRLGHGAPAGNQQSS